MTHSESSLSRSNGYSRYLILAFLLLLIFAFKRTFLFGSRSTNDPLMQLYFSFLISIVGVWAVVNFTLLGTLAASAAARFAGFLTSRGAFVSDAQSEVPKFALLRILFGAFLIWRAINLVRFSFPSDFDSSSILFFYVADIVAALCIFLGFFTQIAFIFLVFVQWHLGVSVLQTATLGNDIAAILSVLLMLTNAGAHISIDAWLMRRNGLLAPAVSVFYSAGGMPSNTHLQLAKFSALFSYWLVCVYSASMHLSEPAWMTGVAGPLLLTNNFMSHYYDWFSAAFSNVGVLVFAARVALWIMITWYVTLLPFVVAGGLLRKLVVIWGVLFFILSTFVLQLGSLGWFEFIFWAGLFWQGKFLTGRGTLAVAYDDRCNLCDRTVNFLLAVDIFRQIELKPVSKNAEFLAEHGISTKDALTDLYGVELARGNATAAGYDFYLLLTRRIFLLLPAYPVLLIGKWLRIGPVVYRWIAERRTRLFGVCELASPKVKFSLPANALPDDRKLRRSDLSLTVFCHIILLGLAFLLVMPAPFAGWAGVPMPARVTKAATNLQGQAYIYGIEPINVFNATDLRMAENWFTISAVGEDGTEHLLPIFSTDGARLKWHASDRVYFGRTVPWRRSLVDGPACVADKAQRMVADFGGLYEATGASPPASYIFRQYYQPLSDVSFGHGGSYVVSGIKTLCEETFKRQELALTKQALSP